MVRPEHRSWGYQVRGIFRCSNLELPIHRLFCFVFRTLVHGFQEAGLGVSVALDGVVYETDVLAASNAGPYMYRHSRMATSSPSTRRCRSCLGVAKIQT